VRQHHLETVRAFLAKHRKTDSEVNRLRSAILDHANAKAALPPGLFTLTVPTGGGKTLTSLSFALEHALRHGLRRVVYVIPCTGAWIETIRGRRRGWRARRRPRTRASIRRDRGFDAGRARARGRPVHGRQCTMAVLRAAPMSGDRSRA